MYKHNFNLQALKKGLTSAPGKLYPRKCDVTKDEEVKSTFKWIKSELKGIDILINNAGIGFNNNLIGIVAVLF